MMSTVIGGAMLPHAPQFFTMPDTEDKKNVEHVRAVAADIGNKLRALKPDLWIIFSNDHAEQFFHNAAPPFTVHVGGEATGEFAGRKFRWKIPSEIGFEIVRSNDGPLAYGHHVSDGTFDLAILRFKTDQLGRGMDFRGLHHFGVLVDDIDAAGKSVTAGGGKHYMDQAEAERIGGFEVKMYGPEGILFDIAEHPWTGTEALPARVQEAAE